MATKYDWNQIKIDYESGMTYDSISQKYGVSKSQISKQAKQKKWKSRMETNSVVSVNFNDNVAFDLYENIKFELGQQITSADNPLLIIFCNQYSRYIRLEKKVMDEGEVLVSPKGGSYLNPTYTALLSATKQLSSISKEFGLSIKSRKSANIKAGEQQRKSEAYDEMFDFDPMDILKDIK